MLVTIRGIGEINPYFFRVHPWLKIPGVIRKSKYGQESLITDSRPRFGLMNSINYECKPGTHGGRFKEGKDNAAFADGNSRVG